MVKEQAIHAALPNIEIHFENIDGMQHVFLNNVDNGTIVNCTIFGTDEGILVDHSEDINITETRIYDCVSIGMTVQRTDNVWNGF